MKRWPIKPLGEVCFINPKLAGSDAPRPDAEVTFVPMAAVDEVSGTIARPERRRYSEVAKGYTPFTVDDVLFAKITPCMQNGKAAVASDLCGGFGFGSTEFHVLRSAGSVLPRWVFAFIRQPAFRSAAEASFTGSAGQQRVPADFLKAFPIPVPPLAEQERIVKLLDEGDELRKLRAQADRRTAALIPSLFHDMFGDPIENPNRWPMATLAEVCQKLTDGTHFSPPPAEKGIPYITAKHLREYGLDFEREPTYVSPEHHRAIYARCDPKPGDVLYIKDGVTTGLAAVNRYKYEFSVLSSLALMRPDPAKCESEFLCAWLNDNAVKVSMLGQMAGAAIRRLTLAKLKISPVLLPPLTLQREFAARVSEIRAMQTEQAASRRCLDDLFQSMLHHAFSGEL